MKIRDQQSAGPLGEQRAEAEMHLWSKMHERGMTREGGWKVVEFTRDTRGGTELVLRPVHLWHESPYDLESVVWVRSHDGVVEGSCTPEPMRRAT